MKIYFVCLSDPVDVVGIWRYKCNNFSSNPTKFEILVGSSNN